MAVHLTATTALRAATERDQATAHCLEDRNEREAAVSDLELLPLLELLSESRLWGAFIWTVIVLNGGL